MNFKLTLFAARLLVRFRSGTAENDFEPNRFAGVAVVDQSVVVCRGADQSKTASADRCSVGDGGRVGNECFERGGRSDLVVYFNSYSPVADVDHEIERGARVLDDI